MSLEHIAVTNCCGLPAERCSCSAGSAEELRSSHDGRFCNTQHKPLINPNLRRIFEGKPVAKSILRGSTMQILTTNFAGKLRRENIRGREYLVAPLTLITPGVLAGSKGPLYYPPEEVSNNPEKWDHFPLTAYHPVDPISNTPISASTDGVWERQGIGYLHNSTYDGKLRSTGYFEIERVKKIDNSLPTEIRILPRLLRGEKIELSTGLYTENEQTQGVSPDGRPYQEIARNYRPDHVAILPDQRGACSIQDGCGVHVTNQPSGMVLHFPRKTVNSGSADEQLIGG